jgi:hypothetical protein
MTLQLGRAQDGVRAFFDDMAQSAEKASTIIYDALHSALDKTSNELANLLTGQKTSWGKMFQSLGHQMVESTIKSGLQRVLGVGGKRDGSSATNALFVQNVGAAGSGQIGDLAPNGDTIAGVGTPAGPGGLLGKLLGLWHKPPAGYGNGGLLGTGQVPKIGTPGGGTVGEPDGSETNPFFVIMSQMAENNEKNPLSFQNQVKKSGGNSPLASFFGGLVGTLLGSSLGISGGGGGGGDTPDVQSSISYPGFASGTDSTPAGAYLVGENGPEIMQGAGKRIYSNQESRRILSSSNPGITYNIDARGTDPHQTEQRVRTALIAVHGSAVSSSMQANVDRAKRVPSRS